MCFVGELFPLIVIKMKVSASREEKVVKHH